MMGFLYKPEFDLWRIMMKTELTQSVIFAINTHMAREFIEQRLDVPATAKTISKLAMCINELEAEYSQAV